MSAMATGNFRLIPEREPEKRLSFLRKAAGAQITQCTRVWGSDETYKQTFFKVWFEREKLNDIIEINYSASMVPSAAVTPAIRTCANAVAAKTPRVEIYMILQFALCVVVFFRLLLFPIFRLSGLDFGSDCGWSLLSKSTRVVGWGLFFFSSFSKEGRKGLWLSSSSWWVGWSLGWLIWLLLPLRGGRATTSFTLRKYWRLK